jgi:hypothetical protein
MMITAATFPFEYKLGGDWKFSPKTTRLFIFYLLAFFVPSFSTAQNTISTSDFLSKALDNQAILLHERQLDFLKNTDNELPWADQLEFRTETDEMDLNRQEYLMRFRYHTRAERQAQRNLHQSDIQQQELKKADLLEEALLDHYFLLVKYVALDREINLLQQQQLVASDKLTVLQKKAAALSDFNLNDLLNAENRTHELELKKMELEGEFQQLKKTMSIPFGADENIQLDTTDILSITALINKIPLLPKAVATKSELAQRQLAIEKTGLELEKEKAENNWQLDYVQFKHASRDNLTYVREWSFGMGVEIPLKGNNKLTKNEIMLERIELENRLALQTISLNERLQKKQQELNLKINQYNLATQQLSDSQLQFSYDNYPQFNDTDPLLLLNIKANILNRQGNLLNIEKDVYLLYLEIIELSGKAVEMPLRNYLNNNWELLE